MSLPEGVKPLDVSVEMVITVESDELDRFIADAYHLDSYESIAAEEWNNYSSYEFIIDRKPLDSYDQAKLDRLLSKGYEPYVTRIVMFDMCNRGWILPGKYIVRVYW